MACSWGTNNPWIELPAIANSYRIDNDNSPDFNDMLRIVSNAEGLARFAGPGHFLDLDMLEIGNLGDEDWYTTTHLEADKAQFAIWCIYKSELTLGTTIENLQNETYKAILTNRELIAWNQDKLGIAGDVVRHEGPNRWLAGPLSDGSRAVVLFNAHTPWQLIDFNLFDLDFADIGLASSTTARVRDVYLPRESRGGGGMQPRHVPACLRRRTYRKYEEVLVPAVKPAALPPGEVLVKVLQFRDT